VAIPCGKLRLNKSNPVGKRIRRPRGKGCEVPTPPTPPPPPPPNQPSMFNAHAAVDCSAHLTRFRYAKEKQTEEIKNVCVPSCQPPFLSIKKRERFPFCNFLPSRNFCLVFFFFFTPLWTHKLRFTDSFLRHLLLFCHIV
jgi:hypothetical protein